MTFSGSIVALITPFRKEKVDIEALEKLVNWQIEQGTTGLLVCGSTGESALLSPQERCLVIETTLRQAKGRVPVMVGCGAPSTHEALEMVQEAKELGGDGALVVTPYYVKPNPRGILAHFAKLNEVGFPLIVYNNPGRAVVGLSVETVVELAQFPWVVGIKDSCGDITRVIKMRHRIQKDFSYLCGDDPLTPAYLAHGGHGAISVTANVVPRLCQDLITHWNSQNYEAFSELRDKLLDLHEVLMEEPNPCPVKYALFTLGFCEETPRLPLVPLEEKTKRKVRETLGRVLGREVG